MHIGRIACFEPLVLGQPPQIVGELFRGLFPFLDDERDCVVAMPLLSAGNQRWPAEAIFGPLAEAAAKSLAGREEVEAELAKRTAEKAQLTVKAEADAEAKTKAEAELGEVRAQITAREAELASLNAERGLLSLCAWRRTGWPRIEE